MNKRISVSTAVRRAFDVVLDNAHVVIPALLAFFGILALIGVAAIFPIFKAESSLALLQNLTGASPEVMQQAMAGFLRDNPHVIGNMFLAFVLIGGVALWLSIGLMHIIFDLYDHGTSSVARLFSGSFKTLLKMLGGSILFVLMFIPALILFVIPGVYLMMRLMFYPYFIVDQDAGVMESFKASWHATSGHFWALLATVVVASLISGLVHLNPLALLLVSGLVVALLTNVYRQLIKQEVAVTQQVNVSEDA